MAGRSFAKEDDGYCTAKKWCSKADRIGITNTVLRYIFSPIGGFSRINVTSRFVTIKI